MLEDIISNQNFIIFFRISLAAVLAFVPGIERELTGKFAGLRTHILVCVGACVFTLLSLYGFKMHVQVDVVGVNDPARIAAQIITGIGFIGAGTVMRHGSNVFGITTAATLWMCAAIGMSCGCGEYSIAIISSFATLLVLIAIRKLEKRFLSKKKISYTLYEISLYFPVVDCEKVQTIFECNFHKIYKFNKKLLNSNDLRINAVISSKKSINEINDIFKQVDTIQSIEVSEHYD